MKEPIMCVGKQFLSDKEIAEELDIALRLVLDSVDYLSGNCRINEAVGAVLPKEIIVRAKNALCLKGGVG